MKTNLLYIFADQWRYHAMGCVGQDQACTPNMDRFAQESLCFEHAYSTFPLCTPHRGRNKRKAATHGEAEVSKKGKTFLPDYSTAATNSGEEWEPRDKPLAKS